MKLEVLLGNSILENNNGNLSSHLSELSKIPHKGV